MRLSFNDPKEVDLTVWTYPVSDEQGAHAHLPLLEGHTSQEQGAQRETQLSCHGLVENERDMLLVTDHQGQVISPIRQGAGPALHRWGRNVLGKNIVGASYRTGSRPTPLPRGTPCFLGGHREGHDP